MAQGTGAEVLVRGGYFIHCLVSVAGLDLISSEREVRETGKRLEIHPCLFSG